MKRQMICVVAAMGAMIALASDATSQSVWGLYGPTGKVEQVTGPSTPRTSSLKGPVIGGFRFDVSPREKMPVRFMPDIAVGDIAVDRENDAVWVTDGLVVANYAKDGTPLARFDNPFAPFVLTGIAWARLNDCATLLITDGWKVAAVHLPLASSSPKRVSYALAPRRLVLAGLATDVDFDPLSYSLFFANSDGTITNELVNGGLGRAGVFTVPPHCGDYVRGLTGIAVDTAAGDALYVTDGFLVLRITMNGTFAEPTFYSPQKYYEWPGSVPISGLAFDASPVVFGEPCGIPDVTPEIGWIGQAISPNRSFALTVANATPHAPAFLLIGSAAAIPPVILPDVQLVVSPVVALAGPFEVGSRGSLILPAPIPIGVGGAGLSVYVQWVVQTEETLFASPGLEMTFGLP